MSMHSKRYHGLPALLVVIAAFLILGSTLLSCAGTSAIVLRAAPATSSQDAQDTEETPALPTSVLVSERSAVDAAQAAVGETGAQSGGWDTAGTTVITMDGNSASVEGSGAVVSESGVTIASGGTFMLRGTLRDGQVQVDSQDELPVTVVLDGVDIRSSTSAPLCVTDAEEVEIILAAGSTNRLEDGSEYVLGAGEDEPNAALFSKADIAIAGSGSLEVVGNYNDGIASKDTLTIRGGTISVEASDDGVRGKDSLVIESGTLTVVAGGDGLTSDNEEDAALGIVLIKGGTMDITSGGDGIDAQTEAVVTGGTITVSSGGGSGGRVDEEISAKGIKGTAAVRVEGGTLTIDSADDAVHSNGTITINGGTLVLSSGDDAVHADATLEINDGIITAGECYEGLESAVIKLNGGEVHVTASDDGINVSGGSDQSGMVGGPGFGGRRGGGPGGWQGQDSFATGDQYLAIGGGYVVVNAGGDGIDANGTIEMSDGVVIVNGPTESINGALDSASFKITGGLLVAAGSAGMAQAPGESSTQYSVLLGFGSAVPAGTLLQVVSEEGETVLTFAPAKRYETLVFSSPELEETTYVVYAGGSSSGASRDGLYDEGEVTGADEIGSFDVTGIVTWVGRSGRY